MVPSHGVRSVPRQFTGLGVLRSQCPDLYHHQLLEELLGLGVLPLVAECHCKLAGGSDGLYVGLAQRALLQLPDPAGFGVGLQGSNKAKRSIRLDARYAQSNYDRTVACGVGSVR